MGGSQSVASAVEQILQKVDLASIQDERARGVHPPAAEPD
jgi:hypothetical protein